MDREDRAKLAMVNEPGGPRPCRLAGGDPRTTCGGPGWGPRHERCLVPSGSEPNASLRKVSEERHVTSHLESRAELSAEARIATLEAEVAKLREHIIRQSARLTAHLQMQSGH